MKVLFVTRGLEPSSLDSVASWLHELSGQLVSRGHHVSVLCTQAELEPADTDHDGVEVLRPAANEVDAALDLELAQEPDVVHVASPGTLSASCVQSLDAAPLLLDLIDWSPLCPATDLMRRPQGEACAEHFPKAPCGECVGHVRASAFAPFMELARGPHSVVAHSTYARDRATLALGHGVSLVPAGVESQHFSLESKSPVAPDVAALAGPREHARVLLLGPPSPARGAWAVIDLLVALHARVHGIELVLAGRDPEDPASNDVLLAEARALGFASQIRVLPRVAYDDLPAVYAACDLGMAPGLAPDPFGLPIVRAMAAGLPVVSHAAGAAPELLRQGEAGVLVDANDRGGFADEVASLLADTARREAYREKGRLTSLEQHDLARALFQTEGLYDRVRQPRSRRILGASDFPGRAA